MNFASTLNENKIVCDNGSGFLKMGYAGDNFPRFTVPSVVGRPMLRSKQTVGDMELREIMYGDEVTPFRALLEVSYPIEEGRVKNWEDFGVHTALSHGHWKGRTQRKENAGY